MGAIRGVEAGELDADFQYPYTGWYVRNLHQRRLMAEMTEEHKAALAQGRRESAAIKAYLAALQTGKKP